MIYGRWQNVVTIKRHALLEDVRKLENRKPDKGDRECLSIGAYIVVESEGREQLCALAFLRADRGSLEITQAIEKLGPRPYDGVKPEDIR